MAKIIGHERANMFLKDGRIINIHRVFHIQYLDKMSDAGVHNVFGK